MENVMHEEALKFALGKIKSARNCHFAAIDPLLFEAEEILETVLAEQPVQPQQEPVALRYDGLYEYAQANRLNYNELCGVVSASLTSQPAQPQRIPLTVEEIAEALPDDNTPMDLGEAFVKFARAIEAAHNIKEKNNG